jgi:hypothetical protein
MAQKLFVAFLMLKNQREVRGDVASGGEVR